MNLRFRKIGMILGLGVLGAVSAGAGVPECAPPGELSFLEQQKPNGTLAQCRFYDASGKLQKMVNYITRDTTLQPPFEEEMLMATNLRVYHYDSKGRRIRMEARLPGNFLSAYSETSYGPDGLTVMTRYAGNGVRQGETLWWEDGAETRQSGPVTNVVYDHSGERVVSIQGSWMENRDLPQGWGEPVKGLSCGIAANRPYGVMSDLVIHSTVRNLTDRKQDLVTNESYWILEPELRNEKDEVIPVDQDRVDTNMDRLIRRERGMGDSVSVLEPAAASSWKGRFKLNDWYAPLPAGDYSFRIHRRRIGAERDLASNTIPLTIVPSSILD